MDADTKITVLKRIAARFNAAGITWALGASMLLYFKRIAPEFDIEAWSYPDGVPEAIRLNPSHGRGYIAATQWHPEFRASAAVTLDDSPLLHDFLAACSRARVLPRPGHSPLQIRDRAERLLRRALLRRR